MSCRTQDLLESAIKSKQVFAKQQFKIEYTPIWGHGCYDRKSSYEVTQQICEISEGKGKLFFLYQTL